MNKIYFITIVVIFSVITQGLGQYTSIFGVESTEWNYLSLYCDAGRTATLTTDRDTIVDNIDYKIVTRDIQFSPTSDIGLIRESEDRSKVWFRTFDESDEILVMDLNLELPDKFVIGDNEYVVDTIYINDDNRKVIELDLELNWCGPLFAFNFIEGVGPNLGFDFIASPNFSSFMSIISCHTKDDVTVNYLSQFFDECAPITLSNKNINVYALDIYPNPTSGELNIELHEALSGIFSVKSLTGQVLFSQEIEYRKELSLDLNGQESGIYLVEVISENGGRCIWRR